ncbi:MAG: hypothetical protein HYU41_12355 [Candidatus Rokubacteria bacterium]|nr:hypothetical protein [Candidatus Rokubacteria bacterium]
MAEAHHFIGDDTHFNVKGPTQRLVDLGKAPFHLVPRFRGSLLLVGRKP